VSSVEDLAGTEIHVQAASNYVESIAALDRRFGKRGLDPNIWFDNVELAAARVIGRETVQYVGSIYNLYLAVRMVDARRIERSNRAGPTPGSRSSSP